MEIDGNHGARKYTKVNAGGQEFEKEPRRQSSNSGNDTGSCTNIYHTCMTHTVGTVEYQTLISGTSKLRTAVSSDLIRLSGCLLAKGLISRDNDSELRNRHIEIADRAARLVELIQQKVNLDPQNYIKFIEVLKEDNCQYSGILKFLNDSYSSLITPGN